MASDIKPPSNRHVVLQAIADLCAANRQASRTAICEITGLSMAIVDDHVKNLNAPTAAMTACSSALLVSG